MTDLKYGICPDAFWLDREQCCWSSNQTAFGDNCSQVTSIFIKCQFEILLVKQNVIFPINLQWLTWPNAVGLSDESAGGYFIAYVSYVLWALSFAGLAAILVRMFAPYASGGGIPEVMFLFSISYKSSTYANKMSKNTRLKPF